MKNSSKRILITGATSGIGLATTKALLNDGHHVVALVRNAGKIKHLLETNPSSLSCYHIDLQKAHNYEDLLANEEKFDGFVHCAGIESSAPLSITNHQELQNLFQVNVFSGFGILRVFSKKKHSNNGASVLFISSVMGILGQPGKTAYSASKAAILGLVKSSALELAKREIRVNALLPGIVETPMTSELFSNLTEKQVNDIKNMHPLGIGKVEDLVPTIQFLLSDNSKWITGQSIIVDGGYSIQ